MIYHKKLLTVKLDILFTIIIAFKIQNVFKIMEDNVYYDNMDLDLEMVYKSIVKLIIHVLYSEIEIFLKKHHTIRH